MFFMDAVPPQVAGGRLVTDGGDGYGECTFTGSVKPRPVITSAGTFRSCRGELRRSDRRRLLSGRAAPSPSLPEGQSEHLLLQFLKS